MCFFALNGFTCLLVELYIVFQKDGPGFKAAVISIWVHLFETPCSLLIAYILSLIIYCNVLISPHSTGQLALN